MTGWWIFTATIPKVQLLAIGKTPSKEPRSKLWSKQKTTDTGHQTWFAAKSRISHGISSIDNFPSYKPPLIAEFPMAAFLVVKGPTQPGCASQEVATGCSKCGHKLRTAHMLMGEGTGWSGTKTMEIHWIPSQDEDSIDSTKPWWGFPLYSSDSIKPRWRFLPWRNLSNLVRGST